MNLAPPPSSVSGNASYPNAMVATAPATTRGSPTAPMVDAADRDGCLAAPPPPHELERARAAEIIAILLPLLANCPSPQPYIAATPSALIE